MPCSSTIARSLAERDVFDEAEEDLAGRQDVPGLGLAVSCAQVEPGERGVGMGVDGQALTAVEQFHQELWCRCRRSRHAPGRASPAAGARSRRPAGIRPAAGSVRGSVAAEPSWSRRPSPQACAVRGRARRGRRRSARRRGRSGRQAGSAGRRIGAVGRWPVVTRWAITGETSEPRRREWCAARRPRRRRTPRPVRAAALGPGVGEDPVQQPGGRGIAGPVRRYRFSI